MIKAVFFDLDNTLTDTEGNSHDAMRQMFEDLHLNRRFDSFDLFWQTYRQCNDEIWRRYRLKEISREELNNLRFAWPMELLGVKDDLLEQKINEVFFFHFLKLRKTMPHAYEVLDYLKNKYRLAVVSNGTKSSQHQKMANFGFQPYFETMVLSDDVGFPKPDKRIFEKTLEIMQVSAAEAIMIGDDFDADIVGAQRAGIRQIWFNPFHVELADGKDAPDYTIADLNELVNIL